MGSKGGASYAKWHEKRNLKRRRELKREGGSFYNRQIK